MFPNGMPALGSNLNKMGLKFGLSSAAGIASCVQGAGSLTYEQNDANDFASWGVDYLKYSDCNGLGVPALDRFIAMRDALNRTSRPIFYSLAKAEQIDIVEVAWNISNSLRTSAKIHESWENVRNSFQMNDFFAGF